MSDYRVRLLYGVHVAENKVHARKTSAYPLQWTQRTYVNVRRSLYVLEFCSESLTVRLAVLTVYFMIMLLNGRDSWAQFQHCRLMTT